MSVWRNALRAWTDNAAGSPVARRPFWHAAPNLGSADTSIISYGLILAKERCRPCLSCMDFTSRIQSRSCGSADGMHGRNTGSALSACTAQTQAHSHAGICFRLALSCTTATPRTLCSRSPSSRCRRGRLLPSWDASEVVSSNTTMWLGCHLTATVMDQTSGHRHMVT